MADTLTAKKSGGQIEADVVRRTNLLLPALLGGAGCRMLCPHTAASTCNVRASAKRVSTRSPTCASEICTCQLLVKVGSGSRELLQVIILVTCSCLVVLFCSLKAYIRQEYRVCALFRSSMLRYHIIRSFMPVHKSH